MPHVQPRPAGTGGRTEHVQLFTLRHVLQLKSLLLPPMLPPFGFNLGGVELGFGESYRWSLLPKNAAFGGFHAHRTQVTRQFKRRNNLRHNMPSLDIKPT
jgi:hypothetical protein